VTPASLRILTRPTEELTAMVSAELFAPFPSLLPTGTGATCQADPRKTMPRCSVSFSLFVSRRPSIAAAVQTPKMT
jgi:hypothetical protein